MIDRYVSFKFLKYLFVVISICSVIIAILVASQELIDDDLTFYNKITILSLRLLSFNNLLFRSYVAMAISLMVIELGKTSQFVIMVSSGFSVYRIFRFPIIIGIIMSLVIIFALQPIEIILNSKVKTIFDNIDKKKITATSLILKDIDNFDNQLIVYADLVNNYDDSLLFKKVLLSKKNGSFIFETLKADTMLFNHKKWILENVYILNNNTKLFSYKDKITINGSVSKNGLLKQIDSSMKNVAGYKIQYNIYQLVDLLVLNKGVSNESVSNLKHQIFLLLRFPIEIICSICIVLIIISNTAMTRRSLKFAAILMPQIAIISYYNIIGMFKNISVGAAKYEFTMIFLPYLVLLCIMIILLNYKKLK